MPAEAPVIVGNMPDCYTPSEQMSMKVNGIDVPVVQSTAESYDFAMFSVGGKATVTITASETISSYSITPLAKGITGVVNGKTLTFEIEGSQYLIIKINNLRKLAFAADEIQTDVPAALGEGIYNITSLPYNADVTGKKVSTEAIQQAIDDAHAAGGGTVYVPEGLFYFDTHIILKSNVHIYLAPGAILRSVADPSKYEVKFYKSSLSLDGTWLIYTETNSKNIRIYGRGIIDANGYAMRQTYKILGTVLVPMQCSNFTVEGIAIIDGGFWSLMPTRSDHVIIQDTKHFNENDILYENDAIDICESQDVLVKHTIAISEDDTYSTKTWGDPPRGTVLNWTGETENVENVVFDDCLAWSRCGAFKVGWGCCNEQKNITFKNSYVYRSMFAINVTHNQGEAAVSDILFENIDIEGYWPKDAGQGRLLEFKIESDGGVSNVALRNINVRDVGTIPSNLKGRSDEYYFDGVTFENIYINGSDVPAASLKEMNITNINEYIKDLKILPFMDTAASKGENLALNKTAFSKYGNQTGNSAPSLALDGSTSTRWGTATSNSSVADYATVRKTQYFTVDLGSVIEFNTVVINWETAYAKEYKLQISNDGEDFTDIKHITNSAGGVETISFDTVNARYIRMQGIREGTQWGYSIWEFEVYNASEDSFGAYDKTEDYFGVRVTAPEGALPTGTAHRVYQINSGSRYDSAMSAVGEVRSAEVYEITMRYDNNTVTPASAMTVYVPVPYCGDDAEYKVFSYDGGVVTEASSKLENGYVVFDTSENGVYVIARLDDGPESSAFIKGDVNGDGNINGTDYMHVRRHFLGTFTIPDENLDRADVDSDGQINGTDFMRIRRHFLGTYTIEG